MKIKEFTLALLAKLQGSLSITSSDANSLGELQKKLSLTSASVSQLNDLTSSYIFKNETEEIEFFKELKPQLLSQALFYQSLLDLKLNEPVGDPTRIKAYYIRKVNRRRIEVRNLGLQNYVASGFTFLDRALFTRADQEFHLFNRDRNVSTYGDVIVSQFLEYELLRNHVERLFDSSYLQPTTLTWTSNKTNLVELIYALHAARAFNEGHSDIKEVATAFEKMFNISLGNYYRHFQDISLRKKAKTVFMDQLKETLEQKLNQAE